MVSEKYSEIIIGMQDNMQKDYSMEMVYNPILKIKKLKLKKVILFWVNIQNHDCKINKIF